MSSGRRDRAESAFERNNVDFGIRIDGDFGKILAFFNMHDRPIKFGKTYSTTRRVERLKTDMGTHRPNPHHHYAPHPRGRCRELEF